MKTLRYTKTLIALSVAIAVAAANVSQAQEQPIPPPPASDEALPANIPPGSPLAEVVKLVQAGVDVSVIKTYISNSANPFYLDADSIIALTDAGVPAEIVNAMMEHDKNLPAATPAPAPEPVSTVAPVVTTPPPAEVTVNYFYDTLTPYGSWVEVEGYGRCWRPTTVIYDTNWRPYCDRGHWVYTDHGWYWDSDYAWGATFHYGRWFQNARLGWCWYPDTVWGPSWVSWRSGGDYCGWAPLPPFAVYRPGAGFFYRGANVAVGFDFGLSVDCFTFVSIGHFNERHPRYYAVDRRRAPDIFRQTAVLNNYHDRDRVIINGGISVDRVHEATHRDIRPVAVRDLPNAARQGWRGGDADRPTGRPGNGAPGNLGNRNSPNGEPRNGSGPRDDRNNPDANAARRPGGGPPALTPNRNGNGISPARPTPPQPSGNRNGQRDPGTVGRNPGAPGQPQPNVNPPVNNPPTPGTPFNRNAPRDPQRPVTSPVAPPVAAGPGQRPPPPEQPGTRNFGAPVPPPPNFNPPANNRPATVNPYNRNPPRVDSAPNENERMLPREPQRPVAPPVAVAPPPRLQPRPYGAPPTPPPVTMAPPPRYIPQVESRPSAPSPRVEAPRSSPPPSAPAPSQPRSSDRADRNADKSNPTR